MNLEDFFVDPLPSNIDPLFVQKISQNEDFYMNRSYMGEPKPATCEYFPHQRFAELLARYNLHDGLLVIDPPGVGKSLLIKIMAEYHHHEYLKAPNDPTKINHAIILVKNDTLRKNIIGQVLCHCEKDYFTDGIRNADTPKGLSNAITASLSKWYTIKTYTEFLNMMKDLKNEEERANALNNKIIFADEGHNFYRMNTEVLNENDNQNETEITSNDEKYKQFFDIFHEGKNTKIIILTATPMINQVSSLALIMNLILPIKALKSSDIEMVINKLIDNPSILDTQQKQEDCKDIAWWIIEELQTNNINSQYLKSEEGIEIIGNVLSSISGLMSEEDILSGEYKRMERYFNGRILYTRANRTGAEPVFKQNTYLSQLVPPLEINLKLFFTQMSEFQYEIYSQAKQHLGSQFSLESQASTLVYPNGDFGTRGAAQYMKEQGNKWLFANDLDPATINLKEYYNNAYPNKPLSILSSKFDLMLQFCLNAYPTEFLHGTYKDAEDIYISNNKGIVFIYFPENVYGSGAADFVQCLLINGYELFDQNKSIFQEATEEEKTNPCPVRVEGAKKRKSLLSPNKRVALITGKSGASLNAILQTVNADENMFGQYLQVIVGSRVSGEGLSIANAVATIFVNPPWTPSRYEQALGRVFRATSHVKRISYLKKLDEINKKIEIEENKYPVIKDGNGNIFFEVSVFLLASIYQPEFYISRKENPQLSQILYSKGYKTVSLKENPMLYSRIRNYKQLNISEDDEVFILSEGTQLYNLIQQNNLPIPSTFNYEKYSRNPRLLTADWNTNDVERYKIIYRKDSDFRKIMRFMKQSAINCIINHERNVLPTDEDNSAQCDYAPCDYPCTSCNSQIQVLNSRNRLLLNDQTEVEELEKEIETIIAQKKSITLSNLILFLKKKRPTFSEVYLYQALNNMSSKNKPITDFWGFYNYLRIRDDGLVFLQKNRYRENIDPFYNHFILPQNPKYNLFVDYMFAKLLEENQVIIKRLSEDPTLTDTEFDKYLAELDIFSSTILVENVIKLYYDNLKDPMTMNSPIQIQRANIINHFSYTIYIMTEPKEEIEKQENIREQTKYRKSRVTGIKSSGRIVKEAEISKIKLSNDIVSTIGEEGTVVVHSFLSDIDTTSKFGQGRLRLFNTNDGLWRDVLPAEFYIYMDIIRKYIASKHKEFESKKIYGVYKNKQFKIRDTRMLSQNVEDRRKQRDGTLCNFSKQEELSEKLAYLKMLPPNDPYVFNPQQLQVMNIIRNNNNLTREEIILLETYKTKNYYLPLIGLIENVLDSFWKKYFDHYNLSITQICDIIYQLFFEDNRILYDVHILDTIS